MSAVQESLMLEMSRASKAAIMAGLQENQNYVKTIAALTVLLDMLDRKLDEIRATDSRISHASTQGHIRSALSYERKVLEQLTDPQGMAMMTTEALGQLLISSPSTAVALLEEKRVK